MAEQFKGTVTNFETKEIQRKDGSGSFEVVNFSLDSGTKLNGYKNTLKGMELKSGDSVEGTYQVVKGQKGSINSLLTIFKAKGSTVTKSAPKPKSNLPVTLSPVSDGISYVIKPLPTAVEVKKPELISKDLSMEVSGLMQALISTGDYTASGHLDRNLLEKALVTALELKRKVANEFV